MSSFIVPCGNHGCRENLDGFLRMIDDRHHVQDPKSIITWKLKKPEYETYFCHVTKVCIKWTEKKKSHYISSKFCFPIQLYIDYWAKRWTLSSQHGKREKTQGSFGLKYAEKKKKTFPFLKKKLLLIWLSGFLNLAILRNCCVREFCRLIKWK